MPSTTSSSVVTDDQSKLHAVIKQVAMSWAHNDAEAMSQLYAEDATVILPGDTYLKGREAVRAWMAAAFEGRWKGTHVLGIPVESRFLGEDVCLVVSQGGAYQPGSTEVSAADAIRGLWVFGKSDGEWAITAYENTPLGTSIPIPQ